MNRDCARDIAVTGMSARFPGCADLDDWWSALTAGRVLTTRYSRDELVAAGVPTSLVDDPDYVPVRGHLADAEHFDNVLFHLSPREAELTDPQHRLMLEVAWAALEDAGVAPREVPHSTGVFASATGSGYLRAMVSRGVADPATLDDLIHGTEPDFMASRIAYKLGLTGPALAIQTACSSALVAVHTATRSLLTGDCDQALVVASGFDFPQAGYLRLPGGVQSPEGSCRPFDQNADGVVGGSGIAAVVLRRLTDALDDGVTPHGVILGTAVNNDGAAKVGYYAPSAAGQEAVIRRALHRAGVDAASIGYLETHGTGTRIGDPIEWAAASAALRDLGAGPGQIAVGAVKANIGHLDAAAGLAGLIKALLVVGKGVVPPVAGFTSANPLLDLDGSPLFIPRRSTPWAGPEPRRAGVSAFGIGGTNAHLIVEQAPAVRSDPPTTAVGRGRLVTLSAADPDALARTAGRLADHLSGHRPDLADVCFTLATGRAQLSERLAVVGRDADEIAGRLRTGQGLVSGHRPAVSGPLVFLFPGQGAQRPGMALAYTRALPEFAEALERCLAAFRPSLRDRLRSALLDVDFPTDELDETALAQPALFAVGWAAATALEAVGLRPAALIGNSLGEITAACAAGILDLTGAAAFVTARGEAMRDCPPGAMLALGCGVRQARSLVAEGGLDLEIAVVNGTDLCVLAGRPEAVAKLHARVGEQMFSRRLRTERAFHSRLIEPAVPRLAAAIAEVPVHPPTVPIGFGVDGRIVAAGEPVPRAMLVDQARRPVRLDAVLTAIGESSPQAVVLEIGPGRTLLPAVESAGLRAVPLAPAGPLFDEAGVLAALGELWTLGQPVLPGRLGGGPGRPIRLPTYPFAGPHWTARELAGQRPPVGAPARPTGETAARPAGEVVRPAGETAPARRSASDPTALLRQIWSELLGHDDLTPDADFFRLGGDSLLITRLARRVNTELGIRVPVRDMLASRTLARQTALVVQLVADGRPD